MAHVHCLNSGRAHEWLSHRPPPGTGITAPYSGGHGQGLLLKLQPTCLHGERRLLSNLGFCVDHSNACHVPVWQCMVSIEGFSARHPLWKGATRYGHLWGTWRREQWLQRFKLYSKPGPPRTYYLAYWSPQKPTICEALSTPSRRVDSRSFLLAAATRPQGVTYLGPSAACRGLLRDLGLRAFRLTGLYVYLYLSIPLSIYPSILHHLSICHLSIEHYKKTSAYIYIYIYIRICTDAWVH